MKLLYSLFILSFLMLNFNSSNYAQPISPVNSKNLPAFLDDLDFWFGDIIEIKQKQIDNYLSPWLPKGNKGNCGVPDPNLLFMNDLEASFSWAAIPGASKYKVGYLNLKTGSQASYVTNTPKYLFQNLPNGLYLVAFQSLCAGSQSDVHIIILDKIVHMQLNSSIGCDCEYGSDIEVPVNGEENLEDVPEFDLIIREGEDIIHKIHYQQADCNECWNTYDFNPFCGFASKILPNEEEGVFYLYYENLQTPLGSFTFYENYENNSAIEFNLPSDFSLYIGYCNTDEKISNNGVSQPSIFYPKYPLVYPNPFSSNIELSLPSQKDSAYSILLQNINGKTLQRHVIPVEEASVASHKTLNLDVLPTGSYFLRIQTDQESWTKKIIKIN